MTDDEIEIARHRFARLAVLLERAHERALDGQHPRIGADGLSNAAAAAKSAIETALTFATAIGRFVALEEPVSKPGSETAQ